MDDKLKALTEAQLGEIKNRAEGAASRLEDSLNAQKSEQQRALMKRLERRRKQCAERIEREVATAAAAATAGDGSPPITAEQKAIMLESALAQLDSQAEAEAAFLEQQNIASVRAVRAQMVALVRAEHEKECERLENELLAQKDKRTKELKLRLERKKAERAKELMNQKDTSAENGSTDENESTPAISVAVAVALASEEMAEQEAIALNSLQAETDASIEAARKQVLDTLKELHDKESVRLEDDLLYQEKMQRANLANRLERQKKIKEKQLLAAAHARTTTSASTTEDTPFDLSAAANRADLQEIAAASMELSIKEQVEREMQQIALQEEAKLQASLDLLKAAHHKESEELHEELQYKRTSADKRLKERLALKQAKQAQQDATTAAAATGILSTKVDMSALRGISIAVTPALFTLAEAEDDPVPEVEVVVPPSDGSIAADEYTATTKTRQKQLLDRLTQFIAFEKSRHIAEKQGLVKTATTKQKKEFALNELAHTSILFDHVSEFLALGLKKTFLYQTKAIKDLIAQLKPDCPIGESVRFSVEQMAQLESKTVVDHFRENACEKILERFQRDLGALVDSQALERRTTLTQMKQNGSSNTQLQASRDEMTEYHTERILTEVEKVILTFTGVFIDASALLETGSTDANTHHNGRSSVKNSSTNNNGHGTNDSDNEDDDLDAFDAHISPSVPASRKQAKGIQRGNLYGQRLLSWFDTVMALLKLYATCPMAFNMACDQQCSEVKILRSSAGVALLELSSEFRPQLSKPLLQVGVQSYLQHMRGGVDYTLEGHAAVEATISAVQRSFSSTDHRANFATLFAQARATFYDNNSNVVSSPSAKTELRESHAQELQSAYLRALEKFIAKPVLTAEEIAHAQAQAVAAAGRAQETTSLSSKSGRLSGAEARKIQLISALNAGTERLKMEVREKYRKLGGGNEVTQNQEIEQLLQAQREVVDMISDDAIRLEEVNADGLIAVVERKAQGAKLGAEDVVDVQKDVQRQKQLERAQKDVQRVLQTASESENKLDVALKIEQAKRQQALHARLTVRRTTIAKK
uniref:Uncharacterized protein n=1 Tax=Spumella elongata TaxID=89044 RepID=A0A7S3HPV5_9STRA